MPWWPRCLCYVLPEKTTRFAEFLYIFWTETWNSSEITCLKQFVVKSAISRNRLGDTHSSRWVFISVWNHRDTHLSPVRTSDKPKRLGKNWTWETNQNVFFQLSACHSFGPCTSSISFFVVVEIGAWSLPLTGVTYQTSKNPGEKIVFNNGQRSVTAILLSTK